MGGPTTLPPVVDDDSLWIGSSRGGTTNNSLVGAVDDVRIHRQIVDTATLKSRRIVVSKAADWPSTALDSEVTVTLHDGLPSHVEFPVADPSEDFRFTIPKVAVHRLPLQYSSGGVRESWDGPVLLRVFARTTLPVGEHELLLRSPGRSRVWVNGHVLVETPQRKLFPDAHQPFEVYEPDLAWLCVPHVGDREIRTRFVSDGLPMEVILESLVGAVNARCELGETMVAVRSGDGMFTLLGPDEDAAGSKTVHLVDQEFLPYGTRSNPNLQELIVNYWKKNRRKNLHLGPSVTRARQAVQETWPDGRSRRTKLAGE